MTYNVPIGTLNPTQQIKSGPRKFDKVRKSHGTQLSEWFSQGLCICCWTSSVVAQTDRVGQFYIAWRTAILRDTVVNFSTDSIQLWK